MQSILKKIDKITQYIKILQEYKKECKSRFLSDYTFRGALLHYLYLMSDSCIVVAQKVLKYKNIDMAQSYYEAIDLLGEKDILPKEFAYEFAKIAGLRNFLAHDYEDVDYLIICDEVLKKLEDVKKFLEYIKKAL